MAVANESLLSILQAHGQTFLDSFGVPEDKKKRKRSLGSTRAVKLAKRETATRSSSVDSSESDSAEEWTGFESDARIEDDGWESPSLTGAATALEGVLAILNGGWEISASRCTVCSQLAPPFKSRT